MTTATKMETKYEVLDEELAEAAAPVPTKKPKRSAEPSEEEADEMATLMQEMAKKTALQTMALMHDEMNKRDAERMAKVEAHAAAIEAKYTKPQNLCLFVKIGEQPVKKLKQRVSPLLPDLLMQVDIGQNGGKWPLIMGPTGSGKTVTAGQIAEAKNAPFFAAINGAEGIGESAFFGRNTKDGFIDGPLWTVVKKGGGFFFDEMDAFSDNVLVGLNAVTSAKVGQPLVNPMSGEVVPLHKDAWFIAATNTNGKGGDGAYTGRNRLDGASLNRFALFELGYDTELERQICPDTKLLEQLWTIRVKLQEKNSKDVVSTRDIADAYAQSARGYSVEKIMKCLMLRMDKSNQDLFKVKGGK